MLDDVEVSRRKAAATRRHVADAAAEAEEDDANFVIRLCEYLQESIGSHAGRRAANLAANDRVGNRDRDIKVC